MSTEHAVEFRYHPMHCTLRDQDVWAILTKQPNGAWRIVNCLDKDERCFGIECAFTTSGGKWPYPGSPQDACQPFQRDLRD